MTRIVLWFFLMTLATLLLIYVAEWDRKRVGKRPVIEPERPEAPRIENPYEWLDQRIAAHSVEAVLAGLPREIALSFSPAGQPCRSRAQHTWVVRQEPQEIMTFGRSEPELRGGLWACRFCPATCEDIEHVREQNMVTRSVEHEKRKIDRLLALGVPPEEVARRLWTR